jgi:chromosome segregation ATPase
MIVFLVVLYLKCFFDHRQSICSIVTNLVHCTLQVSKKDEAMNEIQQDFQEYAKELAALRRTLETVTEERDLSWQEAKQLRRNISIMQNEVVSLKKKIEALDEDILLKEGQITILQDSIESHSTSSAAPGR